MICIVDKSRTAIENLAINQACFEAVDKGEFDEIVRVYTFSRPGAILSKNEDISDIREEYGRKIEITRRHSGGSVVYVDENTIGYNLFTRNNSHDITKTYRYVKDRIIETLSDLGVQNLSSGKWYIRINGKVIAGHAQYTNQKTTDVHGLMRTTKWEMDLLEKTLKLRKLGEYQGEQYIIVDNQPYTLKGEKEEIPIHKIKILRDEYQELADAPGLDELGIEKETLAERIATKLGNNQRSHLPHEIQKRALELCAEFAKPKWILGNGNTQKNLGHCFVDLVERESGDS